MKTINALGFAFFLLVGCSSDKSEVTNITSPNGPQSQIVGNDRDSHGCIPSAGYNWSQTRRTCVRVWEVATALQTSGENPTPTGYYLIFNGQFQPAELFDDKNQSFVLSSSGQYHWINRQHKIYGSGRIFDLSQVYKALGEAKIKGLPPARRLSISIDKKLEDGSFQSLGNMEWPM